MKKTSLFFVVFLLVASSVSAQISISELDEERLPVFAVEGNPNKLGSAVSLINGVKFEYSEDIDTPTPTFKSINFDLSGFSFFYEYIKNRQFGYQVIFSVYDTPPGKLTLNGNEYSVKFNAYSLGFGANIYFDLTTKRGFNQTIGFQVNYGFYTAVVDRVDDQQSPVLNRSVGAQFNQVYYGIDYIQRLYGFFGKIGIQDGHAFLKSGDSFGANITLSSSIFITGGFYRKF